MFIFYSPQTAIKHVLEMMHTRYYRWIWTQYFIFTYFCFILLSFPSWSHSFNIEFTKDTFSSIHQNTQIQRLHFIVSLLWIIYVLEWNISVVLKCMNNQIIDENIPPVWNCWDLRRESHFVFDVSLRSGSLLDWMISLYHYRILKLNKV